jgi:hypothetical protein
MAMKAPARSFPLASLSLPALTCFLALVLIEPAVGQPQQNQLGTLYQLANAKTRSISPESFAGEKGKAGMATLKEGAAAEAARELGQGWKVSPFVRIKPGETFTMADIKGSGIINHIWMTPTGDYRGTIFRIYWDDEAAPSVETPVGDFFCSGWGWDYEPRITSLAICVNPKNGFNSYWPMPFRKRCRVTMENISGGEVILYYSINYAETDVAPEAAYFHAQFRRVNPVTFKDDYTIVDGIRGRGQYVGTYLAHGANSPGWWGEGEAKFFIDGDGKFPTICGTGEEDYFNGSYGFEERRDASGAVVYTTFSSPYSGFYPVKDPAGTEKRRRFGEYRWHITDPIRFDQDLKVTIQCIGWQSGGRYLPLQDDMASVAYWFQSEPHAPFPKLPSRDALSISWADSVRHLGVGAAIDVQPKPSPRYASKGSVLADGAIGTSRFDDGAWAGFEGEDMAATMDLRKPTAVKRVSARFLSNQSAWIFLPATVDVEVSVDGTTYRSVMHTDGFPGPSDEKIVKTYAAEVDGPPVRFIRVRATGVKTCPAWHPGAGSKAWMFIDEIEVE